MFLSTFIEIHYLILVFNYVSISIKLINKDFKIADFLEVCNKYLFYLINQQSRAFFKLRKKNFLSN